MFVIYAFETLYIILGKGRKKIIHICDIDNQNVTYV